MTTDRIAEIRARVEQRREIDASLTPDGTHSSDWYQRQRDELLWTNARLADTVPELLDALAAAAKREPTSDALAAALEQWKGWQDAEESGDFSRDAALVYEDAQAVVSAYDDELAHVNAVLRDALKQATGGTEA